MLGSLIIYLKGMRRMMFQLSGFYYIIKGLRRNLDWESPTLSLLRDEVYAVPCSPGQAQARLGSLGFGFRVYGFRGLGIQGFRV